MKIDRLFNYHTRYSQEEIEKRCDKVEVDCSGTLSEIYLIASADVEYWFVPVGDKEWELSHVWSSFWLAEKEQQ